MRQTLLISICLLLILSGCKKDKYDSKPSLKFLSVSKTELRSGDILVFQMEFTDKEGDISDSIFIQEIVPNCDRGFVAYYPIPQFPPQSNLKGLISFTMGYNATNYPRLSKFCPGSQPDSAIFKFFIVDKAKNRSDTVTSPLVVIY